MTNQEIIDGIVSRIKYGNTVAKQFTDAGMMDSAEMWENMAGFAEGILYDLGLYDTIRSMKEGK